MGRKKGFQITFKKEKSPSSAIGLPFRSASGGACSVVVSLA
jgi:hypothetical protein